MNQSEFIKKALHKPWANRAASFDSMDCWGVVVMYYRYVLGIEIPMVDGYSDGACSIVDGVKQQLANWKKIDKPKNGGVVFLAFSGGEPAHVGVMITPTKMLHSRGCEDTGGSVSLHSLNTIMLCYPKVEFYEYVGDECLS